MSTEDVRIRPLTSAADLRACTALQRVTWGASFADVVGPALLADVQRVGGVAGGAFRGDGSAVGFVFGLPGVERGRRVHWSDMLAVHPERRGAGLGEALKRWQREVVLAGGVRLMRWSFDPLESRNAFLNFSRLGATSREYVRSMYADMDSPLHAGIGTDRLVVSWALDSPRVLGRLDGRDAPAVPDDVASMPLVNPVVDARPFPECRPADLGLEAHAVRVAIPGDIQALKRADPGLALEWRDVTRTALESYFARGYRALELVRYGEWSAYVLEEESVSELTDEVADRALAR